MGHASCVLPFDVPFNVQRVREAAVLYEKNEVDRAAKMARAVAGPIMVEAAPTRRGACVRGLPLARCDLLRAALGRSDDACLRHEAAIG